VVRSIAGHLAGECHGEVLEACELPRLADPARLSAQGVSAGALELPVVRLDPIRDHDIWRSLGRGREGAEEPATALTAIRSGLTQFAVRRLGANQVARSIDEQ